jgi:hypothetical protein
VGARNCTDSKAHHSTPEALTSSALLLPLRPVALQVRHPGALPFSALVAALMIIMAAVFVTQQGFMQGGGGAGGKRRPLRSTERED